MFDSTYKVKNSRRHKRLAANYLLKYQIIDAGDEVHISNLKDISAGGVRFWSDRFIPQGSMLRLNILVPPLGRAIHAFGKAERVRFSTGARVYYVGVSFVEMYSEDLNALTDMIEDLSRSKKASAVIHHPEVVIRQSPYSLAP